MNKKYKSAFSTVCPSENSVERIFDMTKNKKITFKPFLLAAIIVIFASLSLVSANAVTDGALVETAEEIMENIKIFINGEEATPEDVGYKHSTETVNGEKIDKYSFAIGEDGTDGYFSLGINEDGYVIDGDGFDAVMVENGQDGFKAKVEAGDNSFDVAVADDNANSDDLDMDNFKPDYAVIESEPEPANSTNR